MTAVEAIGPRPNSVDLVTDFITLEQAQLGRLHQPRTSRERLQATRKQCEALQRQEDNRLRRCGTITEDCVQLDGQEQPCIQGR